ncbi:hypothetical protein V1511DRAFT_346869 [Dipodascopsis uninucleata]
MRSYCQCHLRHRSGKSFNGLPVEILLVAEPSSSEALAICQLHEFKRYLLFPTFRHADLLYNYDERELLISLASSDDSLIELEFSSIENRGIWSAKFTELFRPPSNFPRRYSTNPGELNGLQISAEITEGLARSNIPEIEAKILEAELKSTNLREDYDLKGFVADNISPVKKRRSLLKYGSMNNLPRMEPVLKSRSPNEGRNLGHGHGRGPIELPKQCNRIASDPILGASFDVIQQQPSAKHSGIHSVYREKIAPVVVKSPDMSNLNVDQQVNEVRGGRALRISSANTYSRISTVSGKRLELNATDKTEKSVSFTPARSDDIESEFKPVARKRSSVFDFGRRKSTVVKSPDPSKGTTEFITGLSPRSMSSFDIISKKSYGELKNTPLAIPERAKDKERSRSSSAKSVLSVLRKISPIFGPSRKVSESSGNTEYSTTSTRSAFSSTGKSLRTPLVTSPNSNTLSPDLNSTTANGMSSENRKPRFSAFGLKRRNASRYPSRQNAEYEYTNVSPKVEQGPIKKLENKASSFFRAVKSPKLVGAATISSNGNNSERNGPVISSKSATARTKLTSIINVPRSPNYGDDPELSEALHTSPNLQIPSPSLKSKTIESARRLSRPLPQVPPKLSPVYVHEQHGIISDGSDDDDSKGAVIELEMTQIDPNGITLKRDSTEKSRISSEYPHLSTDQIADAESFQSCRQNTLQVDSLGRSLDLASNSMLTLNEHADATTGEREALTPRSDVFRSRHRRSSTSSQPQDSSPILSLFVPQFPERLNSIMSDVSTSSRDSRNTTFHGSQDTIRLSADFEHERYSLMDSPISDNEDYSENVDESSGVTSVRNSDFETASENSAHSEELHEDEYHEIVDDRLHNSNKESLSTVPSIRLVNSESMRRLAAFIDPEDTGPEHHNLNLEDMLALQELPKREISFILQNENVISKNSDESFRQSVPEVYIIDSETEDESRDCYVSQSYKHEDPATIISRSKLSPVEELSEPETESGKLNHKHMLSSIALELHPDLSVSSSLIKRTPSPLRNEYNPSSDSSTTNSEGARSGVDSDSVSCTTPSPTVKANAEATTIKSNQDMKIILFKGNALVYEWINQKWDRISDQNLGVLVIVFENYGAVEIWPLQNLYDNEANGSIKQLAQQVMQSEIENKKTTVSTGGDMSSAVLPKEAMLTLPITRQSNIRRSTVFDVHFRQAYGTGMMMFRMRTVVEADHFMNAMNSCRLDFRSLKSRPFSITQSVDSTFSSMSGSSASLRNGVSMQINPILHGSSVSVNSIGLKSNNSTTDLNSWLIRDLRCRLFLRQNALKWRNLGPSKLTIQRDTEDRKYHIIVKRADDTVVFDLSSSSGRLERLGRTGVAIHVLDDLPELSADVDNDSTRPAAYMLQFRNEKEALLVERASMEIKVEV